MTPVGTYVVNGVTSVYTQPAETDPIGDIPYTATPAPTSSCVSFASAAIFTDGVGVTAAAGNGASASATGSGSSATAASGTSGASGAKSTGATKPTGSTSGPAPSTSGSSGAISVGVSAGAMAMAFFAMLAQN
ncbi:hypothetical protein C8R44DRAFT_725988 [Mycena epipterygia]|nr:hypothetical protein C8R44DRAFT_725988 [Mycena epipterygia]